METATTVKHPLERLMRDHPRGNDTDTEQALAILWKEDPSDVFSFRQWAVGLPYFQQRLLDWGLSGQVCLDFGCGTGNWTCAASRVFGRVIGIDKHERRLRAAILIRDALKIRNVVFESDYSAMNTSSGQLDCILFYNVLPFIVNRKEAIQGLIPWLAPTGRIVVSFNEIGVCPYYFLNGIRYFERSYLKKAFIVPAYFFFHRFLRARSMFESTHGWLRTADVVSFFGTLGFEASWNSWDKPIKGSVFPLFPHKKFSLPFFREIVFQKPRS
jgi:ubiquinone/menaquinone biosynthesis C-methylase UbiE